MLQALALASFRARCGGANHFQADFDLHFQIGFLALLQIAMPGEEMIDPRFDREKVKTELLDAQVRAPAIVCQSDHPRRLRARLTLMAMQQDSRQHVVAVGEDVRFDRDGVTGDALCRKSAVIDARRDTFNDDAAPPIKIGLRHESASCELHALLAGGEQRAAGGKRIMKREQPFFGACVAEGRFPPIWVAAHGPRMLDIAGRLGDGWLPMLLAPDDYRARLDRILAARRAAGVDRPFEAGVWTYMCIGESKEDCLRLFESPVYKVLALQLPAAVFEEAGIAPPLGPGSYGLDDFIPSRWGREEILGVLERIPPELVGRVILHGSAADVAAELRALEAAGCEHAVLWNISFLTDTARLAPSFAAQAELIRELHGSPAVPA